MTSSPALRRSVHAAFKSLIDYAGLFPPAALGMTAALHEYATASEGAHAWMLGRFIVPFSRLEEMGDRRREFPLSVLVNFALPSDADTGRWVELVGRGLKTVARERDAGARVEALEVAIPPPRWQRETFEAPLGQLGALLERENLRDVPTYAELSDAGAMSAAKRARLGVKLRCGGLDASAFPSVEAVAAFISAASEDSLPFKATAGLHHPVRHVDAATGFTMQGFLNLLSAAVFAPRADSSTLCAIVAEEDPHAFSFEDDSFAWRDLRCESDELRAVRKSSFVGYGSCSFDEPVDDLTALAILPANA
ncbi:MAG TPA: hypothetical protein VFE36_17125 [Candidatus Baltobacteraceae bacterium]|jgi:hypothetical protein|nr:hypothetical protein [Candidatus Baltobacteraceae bacterium]